MTTLTPANPAVTGTTLVPIVPTASDQIPCSAYKAVLLVVRTGGTNTYAATIDDPTSQGPAGATAYNPDLATGTVPISTVRVFRLETARFKDANGNINLTSSSTFTGTTLEAYGVTA